MLPYRNTRTTIRLACKDINMNNKLLDYTIVASKYFCFLRVKEKFDRECANSIRIGYKFNMLKPIIMISNFDSYKTIRSIRDGKIYKRYNNI